MKWEYQIIGILKIRQDNEIRFNYLGKNGWELISVDNDTAYFGRPKEQELSELSEESKRLINYFRGKDD